jgi:hypothetical protein
MAYPAPAAPTDRRATSGSSRSAPGADRAAGIRTPQEALRVLGRYLDRILGPGGRQRAEAVNAPTARGAPPYSTQASKPARFQS